MRGVWVEFEDGSTEGAKGKGLVNTICAYCGAPDAASAGLRKATQAERADASRDWRRPRSGLPTMIGFDARGQGQRRGSREPGQFRVEMAPLGCLSAAGS